MTEESTLPAGARRAGPWPGRVVLLVAAVWLAGFGLPRVWTATGIGEGDRVFLDLEGLLAAGEAAQQGLDPYRPNPLDVYHRPHVYTAWWLVTGKLGLTRGDARWLGAVLAGLTLLGAVALVRPAGGREAALAGLVLTSPALLMAVNRANNDLVAFLLMSGALGLLRQSRATPRGLGVVLLALAAVLKYYPLAAGVVLLDARTRREWLGWLVLYGLVLLLAWPALVPGLQAALKYRPSPEWLYAFGAPVVFRNFGLAAPAGWLLAAGGLAVAAGLARGAAAGDDPGPDGRSAEREAAGGAAMVVACFALGSSYAYKLVFAVWLLPWLWRAGRPGTEERWRRVLLGLLLAVLWLEGLGSVLLNVLLPRDHSALGLRLLAAVLLVSQLLTWALVVGLLRHLLIFTRRRLARLFGRALAPAGP